MIQSRLPMMVFAAFIMNLIADAGAGEFDPADLKSLQMPASIQSGIRIERISPSYLQLWKSIEQIVQKEDRAGRPMYPVVQSLWQWAAGGPHVLYVDIAEKDGMLLQHAGRFVVEKFDSEGGRHVGLVQLFPPVIDKAYPEPKDVSGNGDFIRFEGLNKEERYVEVLGHELAHAYSILSDPEYAKLYRDLQTEIRFPAQPRSGATRPPYYDDETIQHLIRRQSLLAELEKFALPVEAAIWSELGARGRSSTAVLKFQDLASSLLLCKKNQAAATRK